MKIVALTSGSANSKGKVKVTLRLAKEIFIPQVKPKGAVFLALNVPPPEASGLWGGDSDFADDDYSHLSIDILEVLLSEEESLNLIIEESIDTTLVREPSKG